MSSPSESPGRHTTSHPETPPVPGETFQQVPPPPAATGRAFTQVPAPPPGALAAVSQRLHPAALGVWALGGVRPLVLLIIAGSFNVYIALAFVALAAVGSVARWMRFTWRLEPDALVIDQGVVQRQRRVIPLERIQSVEVVRKLGHRMFGVLELRVESIGSGGTEGQLDALDPALARQLRRQLLRKGTEPPATADHRAPAAEPPALVRMRPGQLVLAGITGGRVGVFAALVGFASQVWGERIGDAVDWLAGYVGTADNGGVVTVALILGGGAILVAFVLSVIATTLTFWNFTLTRDDRNLYTSRGLLDQRSGTIPLHRVQSVRIEENAVRRMLGLAAVKVEVAGQPGGGSVQETATVLPLGRRRTAAELVGTILDRDDVAEVPLEPMPTGARDRRLVRAAVATVALTAGAVWWLGVPGSAALLLAVPLSALAVAAYRSLGHAAPEGLLLARSGVMVRTTHVTRERSLQAVAVTSTPFQRRRGLATLVLHIARSLGGGGDPEIIDVSTDHADAELLRLARASDETARRPSTPQGPTVRAARPEDGPAVEALVEASRPAAVRPLGPEADEALSLVVDDGGDVVGHALLVPLPGDATGGKVRVLRRVVVHPDRRRQGLGTMLVKASLSAAAQQGVHRVVASGAPAFYRSLGFDPVEDHRMTAPNDPSGPWLVRLLPGDDGSAADSLPSTVASD
jgi:putative membrane protein